MAEAFNKYVLNDPEVTAAGVAAMRRYPEYERIFRGGQYPGPMISYAWRLDDTGEELAYEFVRPLGYFPGDARPIVPADVRLAGALLADRIKAIADLLKSGTVVAVGTSAKTDLLGPIPRMQWHRRELWIDVQNSDLLETEGYKPALRWSGIVVEVPPPTTATASTAAKVETPPFNAGSHPNHPSAPPQSRQSLSVQRESIDAAIQALWPDGIPPGMAVQTRDHKINEWQKQNGRAIVSERTIRRHLGGG